MSRLALLFPGQGSQFVGMGKTFHDASLTAREMFRRADAVLGYSLTTLCFEGPVDTLRATENAQPALFTVSAIAATLLKERGIEAEFVAGHSLGECTALWAAGCMDFETGLALVRQRGELMARSGREHPGSMAAILGLDAADVIELCRQSSGAGIVEPANFNCPGQVVISGEKAGIEMAMAAAKAKGALKTILLPVSGAFHSRLLVSSAAEFSQILRAIPFRSLQRRIVSNVTAGFYPDAAAIPELLTRQLSSPVQWEEDVRTLVGQGADRFIETGPGSVLTGLLKRIDKTLSCTTAGEWRDIQAISL